MEEEFDADTDGFEDEIADLVEEELDEPVQLGEDDDFDEADGKRKLGHRKYFYIRNKRNGKYLEVAAGRCHNGNNIHLWHFTGSKAQQFYWHKHNGKSYLVNAGCHKVVDIARGNCATGANLHLWTYHGRSNQVFKRYGDILYNPTCQTAIDNSYNRSYNGNNIQSYWYNPYTPAQQWSIEHMWYQRDDNSTPLAIQ